MHLDYMLFDLTDEEIGSCSFDALASVASTRLPALLAEVEAVLAWAHNAFGTPSIHAGEGAGEWDFELQAEGDDEAPLEIHYDSEHACVRVVPGPCEWLTLALTISGCAAFGAAFRDAFEESE